MRNLHLVQGESSINSPGMPEIGAAVFEELLVNSLVHRDYLISAPIRIFIFDNRIEIISPGHLPNNLTVEKICTGNSNIRNPILVSYIAKGLLPYKGIGSGIRRALEQWPNIDFTDDREGSLFTVTVHRQNKSMSERSSTMFAENGGNSPEKVGKTEGLSGKCRGNVGETEEVSGKILTALAENPYLTAPQLAEMLAITTRTVERKIAKLKNQNLLARVGSARSGYWKVQE